MSVKVRLGVGNSFAPVGNQEQFEAIQKQSGSNGGGGGEEGDERTQLTGGDGDPPAPPPPIQSHRDLVYGNKTWYHLILT